MCVSQLFFSSVCFLKVNYYFKHVNTRDVTIRCVWTSLITQICWRFHLREPIRLFSVWGIIIPAPALGVLRWRWGRCFLPAPDGGMWWIILTPRLLSWPLRLHLDVQLSPDISGRQLWAGLPLSVRFCLERPWKSVKISHAGRAWSMHTNV